MNNLNRRLNRRVRTSRTTREQEEKEKEKEKEEEEEEEEGKMIIIDAIFV